MRYVIIQAGRRIGIQVLLALALIFGSMNAQAASEIDRRQTDIAQSTALPDLIIEKIVVSPPNPGAGSMGDIEVTVKNIGDAHVTDFGVYLYVEPVNIPPTLSTPETTRAFYGLEPIAPGGTWSFSRTGHTFTQANPKIYAWVDRNNTVAESNETNNLFPTPLPQGIDNYEQDDDCSTAKPLLVGAEPRLHTLFREPKEPDNIAGPDEDWVKLEVQAGIMYVVSAVALGSDANLVLSSRSRCASPGSLGAGQTYTFTAFSNTTYYFSVGHVSSDYGPDTAYLLNAKTDERCGRFEPNNSCEVASELYAGGEAVTSTFCAAGDQDWYRFEVQAGVRYTMTAANTGSKANVRMQLQESCTSNVINSGFQLSYEAWEKGFLYLRLQNQDPQSAGIETEHKLTITADVSRGCEEDRYENGLQRDDDRANAQPLTVNAQQIHNICPAGDKDWVKFTVVDPGIHTAETFDLADQADSKLCLYDASGKELQCDDDSGGGKGARIVTTLTSGDYFVKVHDLNPKVSGNRSHYTVRVLAGRCKMDEFEPDNNRNNTKLIPTDNTTQKHNICDAGDEDWSAFQTQANTAYILETTDIKEDADTVLELYDSSGTLLASNDDYSDSIQSLVNYTFTTAGEYYVKTRLYNPTSYGEGSAYSLRIRQGIATVDASPTVDAAQKSDVQPPPGGTRTLILVNQVRLMQLYGSSVTQQLMNKLEQLLAHEKVQGEIVRLDEIADVQQAYDQWLLDPTSVGRANQTADAIRRTILRYRTEHAGLQYLILVGDDRVIPFYRIPDTIINNHSENTYTDVNNLHPTGAALRANYYLSDDFYVTRTPRITPSGQMFYVPELSVGRLIETPTDMVQFIDRFLANPSPPIERVLVTGWDFVTDVAQENCSQWRKILQDNTQTKVNCDLIGNYWTQQQLRGARLQTNPVTTIQSINGHAAHFGDQSPDKATVTTTQIEGVLIDYGGGLVYSVGCHGGLNVPPENSGESGTPDSQFTALDLPEVFLRKGANYVGNTGFGYGSEAGIVLSEQLVQYYTEALADYSFGKALVNAKRRYADTLAAEPTAYEQKVMQQLVYYGLPMFQEKPPSLAGEDPFPGVGFNLTPPSLGVSDTFNTRAGSINFANGDLQVVETVEGDFVTLSGQSTASAGQPILPLYHKELGSPNRTLRSLLVVSATYSITSGVDPLVLTPINEYSTVTTEQSLDATGGWYPSVPLRLQAEDENMTVAAQVAQYNPSSGEQRQFSSMGIRVLSSNSVDEVSPTIYLVDGLYNPRSGTISVKVGALDSSGIYSVTIVYDNRATQNAGTILSTGLRFDPIARKWVGSFPGTAQTKFYTQVIDGSGNKSDADNKGHWFAPATIPEGSVPYLIFLPVVQR